MQFIRFGLLLVGIANYCLVVHRPMFGCDWSVTEPLDGDSIGMTLVNEVGLLVQQSFVDPKRLGVDWEREVDRVRLELRDCHDREIAASTVNHLLSRLNTSHTQVLTIDEPQLYELLGVFSLVPEMHENHLVWLKENGRERLEFEGIGIRCERVAGRWLVRHVLPGTSASKAGLQVGDELLTIDQQPFHPMHSFEGKSGTVVAIKYNRPDEDFRTIVETQLVVETFDPVTMYLTANEKSTCIRELADGTRLGYLRLWSYAGDKYHEQLKSILLDGSLSTCDGLVLDLRGAWGGASLDYVEFFLEPIATVNMQHRDGRSVRIAGRWTKPVVLVIDETVRSGKELFAYGFRKRNRGPIIGAKTAGALSGGSLFLMRNGCLLYLATSRVFIDDEDREGQGIEPTISVPWDWKAQGDRDLQVERAFQELELILRKSASELPSPLK